MSDFTIVVRSRLHGQPTAVQQEWLERGSEAPGEWRGHVLLGFLFSTYKSFAFYFYSPSGSFRLCSRGIGATPEDEA